MIPSTTPRTSVVIPTMDRPGYLRTCLDYLAAQVVAPTETIVVDSSSDSRSYEVVADFPHVRYLHNPLGAGHLAESRQLGVSITTGEIIAFLDDDAFPRREWLARLLEPYADASIGGVGGRVLRDIPGEERPGRDGIGRLLPNGVLTGDFSADPGRVIAVDHLLGANMSYRRLALDEIGGIHGGYPGTCLREETDTALRLRNAGWELRFQPAAVVDHVAAPYSRGQRFDARYDYYAARNHVVLLVRVLGPRSAHLRRYTVFAAERAFSEVRRSLAATPGAFWPGSPHRREAAHAVAAGAGRGALVAIGTAVGFGAGLVERRRDHAGSRERGTSPAGTGRELVASFVHKRDWQQSLQGPRRATRRRPRRSCGPGGSSPDGR